MVNAVCTLWITGSLKNYHNKRVTNFMLVWHFSNYYFSNTLHTVAWRMQLAYSAFKTGLQVLWLLLERRCTRPVFFENGSSGGFLLEEIGKLICETKFQHFSQCNEYEASLSVLKKFVKVCDRQFQSCLLCCEQPKLAWDCDSHMAITAWLNFIFPSFFLLSWFVVPISALWLKEVCAFG